MQSKTRSAGATNPEEAQTATIAALTDVLRVECRLLQELLAVVRRQREAVVTDDLPAVEESVYATHRVLHTLNEARRQRRSINRLLGEPDDLSLDGIGHALGPALPDDLRGVRDDLERLARALTLEVESNRKILQKVLAAPAGGADGDGPVDASASGTAASRTHPHAGGQG